ncbi:hypothetical protein MKQ68_22785 [Chitinophaga horti]|uniref:Outer membrane protein beta-barrel domain-containing protein n=1 Tax=Chitinophaga horti TaxID=2920382 RepID=A0ABY6J0G4_9BACT|nr:hypothetical protein [Chitinophaga horti]UYQ92911.1 hypothetical protein MKQ68_22785 [Chitinophaga horti]
MRTILLLLLCALYCQLALAQQPALKLNSIHGYGGIYFSGARPGQLSEMPSRVKETAHFPAFNTDTLYRENDQFINTGGAHIAVYTSWQFYNKRRDAYSTRKELRLGVEYLNYNYKTISLDTSIRKNDVTRVTSVAYKPKRHYIGAYADFLLKSSDRRRIQLFGGAGLRMMYSFTGQIRERLTRSTEFEDGSAPLIQEVTMYHNMKNSIETGLIFPFGVRFFPQGKVSFGIEQRFGVLFIKEPGLAAYISGNLSYGASVHYRL